MLLSKKAMETAAAEALTEALRLYRQAGWRTPTDDWRTWLPEMFPRLFTASFAAHHAEFWEWVEAISPGTKPRPFFAVWARGAAKTTSAETAVVRLGAKRARKFCLYVRATQDKANESVQNIAAMLESDRVAQYYPKLSERKLSKYGFARGWRVDMLRCASSYSVVGLGLDAAVRGIKIEEARPDLIVLDDVDVEQDAPKTVAKKIDILTKSILPAGSPDVAILGVQNLVHGGGIFDQVVQGSADFLYGRIVSGPHPAVRDLEYEQRPGGGYRITGGEATWDGQSLEVCEQQINEWGLTAFLREAQHDMEQHGGIWDHVEFQHCALDEIPDLERGAVWVDPAVTATDESDAMGIQADGLGVDGNLYRLYSWEQITTPEDVLQRAILKAVELGLETVGVETDQGGDVWRSAYDAVWRRLIEEEPGKVLVALSARAYPPDVGQMESLDAFRPRFAQAKAGAGHGSKVARNQRMLVSYEHGRVIHVTGTHQVLERSLRRFPNKPLDLADAAYWGWYGLMGKEAGRGRVAKVGMILQGRARPAQDSPGEYTTLEYLGDKSFQFQRWYITPGWSKKVDRATAEMVAGKFPEHFRIVKDR
jgi:hypothetical protein